MHSMRLWPMAEDDLGARSHGSGRKTKKPRMTIRLPGTEKRGDCDCSVADFRYCQGNYTVSSWKRQERSWIRLPWAG